MCYLLTTTQSACITPRIHPVENQILQINPNRKSSEPNWSKSACCQYQASMLQPKEEEGSRVQWVRLQIRLPCLLMRVARWKKMRNSQRVSRGNFSDALSHEISSEFRLKDPSTDKSPRKLSEGFHNTLSCEDFIEVFASFCNTTEKQVTQTLLNYLQMKSQKSSDSIFRHHKWRHHLPCDHSGHRLHRLRYS